MNKEQQLRRAIEAGKKVAARCDMSDPALKKLAESELENVAQNEERLKKHLEKKNGKAN